MDLAFVFQILIQIMNLLNIGLRDLQLLLLLLQLENKYQLHFLLFGFFNYIECFYNNKYQFLTQVKYPRLPKPNQTLLHRLRKRILLQTPN